MTSTPNLQQLLQAWGGEELAIFPDSSGAYFLIARHNSRLGPPTGGTRMRRYGQLEDAIADVLALSEGMTLKYAAVGFASGGGKGVIALPPGEFSQKERRQLLLRYGKVVAGFGGRFRTGPDVGTGSPEMDILAEVAAPFVFCRSPENGGAGSSAPCTAVGVLEGILCAHERLWPGREVSQLSVAVQGAGGVGGLLVQALSERGAKVWVTDIDPTKLKPLTTLPNVFPCDPADIAFLRADVFSPCALGGVLGPGEVERLQARAVVGAANQPLTSPQVAENLRTRGILYAPDFLVSVGGALGIIGQEAMGWTPAKAEAEVRAAVRTNLLACWGRVDAEKMDAHAAALQLAQERVRHG